MNQGEKAFAAALLLLTLAFGFWQLEKMRSIYFNLVTGIEFGEIYLLERDILVSGNSSFTVYASKPLSCSKCGQGLLLSKGENRLGYEGCLEKVSLECLGGVEGKPMSLEFAFQQAENRAEEQMEVSEFGVKADNLTLCATLKGSAATNGFRRMHFLVDGEEKAAPLVFLNGPFEISQAIGPVQPGRKNVTVEFLGKTLASGAASVPGGYDYSLLAVAAASIAFLLAGGKTDARKIMAFFVFLAAAFTIHFRLEYYGFGWAMALGAWGVAAKAWADGRAKQTKVKAGAGKKAAQPAEKAGRRQGELAREGTPWADEKKLLAQAALFALAVAAYVLLMVLLVGKEDVWGSYYYRQAQQTLERGTTDYVDALSYLGRNFTYPPGFMEFAAQAARLAGASDISAIQVPFSLAVVAFYAFTLWLVFRKWKGWQRLLACLLVLAEWATVYTATGITLHLFSYGFLNIALALLEEKLAVAAIALALSVIAHPTSAVLFPAYSFMARKFAWDREWLKKIVLAGAIAGAMAAPFFIPIFLKNGMPNEIVPQKWGYLLSFGLEGLAFDFQFALVVALVAAAFGLARGATLPSAAILLFFLANAFVSFRANLFLAFSIAAGVPLILERNKSKALVALVFAVVAINYFTAPVISSGTKWWCTWGQANDACVSPMKFIGAHSSSADKVAINPYFGHLEAFYGKRPVLADLYVEWADYDKWKAENDFYEQRNLSSLEPYNITLYVLDDLHEKRSVPGDRVYDNGFMHVFQKSVKR